MRIHDDGKSFDVEHMLHSRQNKRLGLIGMRERVEMVGGRFNATYCHLAPVRRVSTASIRRSLR